MCTICFCICAQFWKKRLSGLGSVSFRPKQFAGVDRNSARIVLNCAGQGVGCKIFESAQWFLALCTQWREPCFRVRGKLLLVNAGFRRLCGHCAPLCTIVQILVRIRCGGVSLTGSHVSDSSAAINTHNKAKSRGIAYFANYFRNSHAPSGEYHFNVN